MLKKKDLSGTKIHNLEVLSEISCPYTGTNSNRKTILKLECKCICGEIFFPYKTNVMTGKTKQCIRCSQTHKMLNKKFGSLLVLERDFSQIRTSFKCKCDCGNISVISDRFLKRAKDLRCKECIYKESLEIKIEKREVVEKRIQKRKDDRKVVIEDLIGKKSGKLTILSFLGFEKRKKNGSHIIYSCVCDCGNTTSLRSDHFKKVLSCGCLQAETAKTVQSGENNKRATLTNAQANEIRELFSSGLFTITELAKTFKVHLSTVSDVIKNKTYKIV